MRVSTEDVTEEYMCGDLCDLLTDVCLGVGFVATYEGMGIIHSFVCFFFSHIAPINPTYS